MQVKIQIVPNYTGPTAQAIGARRESITERVYCWTTRGMLGSSAQAG